MSMQVICILNYASDCFLLPLTNVQVGRLYQKEKYFAANRVSMQAHFWGVVSCIIGILLYFFGLILFCLLVHS